MFEIAACFNISILRGSIRKCSRCDLNFVNCFSYKVCQLENSENRTIFDEVASSSISGTILLTVWFLYVIILHTHTLRIFLHFLVMIVVFNSFCMYLISHW